MRYICILAAAAAIALAPARALPQNYPEKPVRVVVVFPPGGSNDVVARIVFQKMSETLGHQFIIDNRGGAAGTIGSDVVAQSPPDGYTLMVQSATHVANPHLYKTLPFDVLKDFIGVTTLARQVGEQPQRIFAVGQPRCEAVAFGEPEHVICASARGDLFRQERRRGYA